MESRHENMLAKRRKRDQQNERNENPIPEITVFDPFGQPQQLSPDSNRIDILNSSDNDSQSYNIPEIGFDLLFSNVQIQRVQAM